MDDLKGLGKRQRELLRRVCRRMYAAATSTNPLVSRRARSIGVHVPIRGTPSERATYSRAMASLARRGLLVPRKGRKGVRTVDVWIDPALAAAFVNAEAKSSGGSGSVLAKGAK